MNREEIRTITQVRKNLHFSAGLLGVVWERTADPRADEALELIGEMRHEYDEAWKAAAEDLR